MIAQLLEKVCKEYTYCRMNQPFKGNPLGEIVRREIVDEIQQMDCIANQHIVKGSIGQGTWATVPWVSILDERITTTTQNGIYIVYLFSQDEQAVYLTLNQGCTELLNQIGKSAAINLMNRIAENIRAHVAVPHGFTASNDITLGNLFYEQGCIFYKKYDRTKMPAETDIETDLRELIISYNAYYEWKHPVNAKATIVCHDSNPKIKEASFNMEILADEKFSLLTAALKEDDIDTVEKLRQINILRYLNTKDLYIWKERIRIAEELNQILGDGDRSEESPGSLAVINDKNNDTDTAAKECTDVIDFTSKIDYARTKPYKFVFRDMEHETRSWADLLVQLCEVLIEIDPDEMKSLIERPVIETSTRLFFCSRKIQLYTPRKLSNGVWVEANLTAKDFVRICSAVCKRCGIEPNELQIYYSLKVQNASSGQKTRSGPTPATSKKESSDYSEQYRAAEIEAFIKTSGITATSIDNIYAALPGIKKVVISSTVEADPQFVEISKNRYIHRSNIVDLEEAAEAMLNILISQFARFYGHTSSRLLYDAVRIDLSLFLNDNDFDNMETVYYLAKHLFSKENYGGSQFIFYSNTHIWEKEPDYPKNLKGLIINYTRSVKGIITREECEDYLDKIGIAYSSINQVLQISNEPTFMQYRGGSYLLAETMQINDAWKGAIKARLNNLLKHVQCCIARDVKDDWFDTLPDLPFGLPWTRLLLQEVLEFYTEEIGFKTIPALPGQSFDTLHAAITATNSTIQTFADVVYEYLRQETKLPLRMSAEELRLSLCDAGMISGNELILNMHKALNDYRFAWSDANRTVHVH